MESLATSGKYRQTLPPGGVLVKKAKETNAIDACRQRESSIGEHLYWFGMNPDGIYHKVVYRCVKFVAGSSLSEAQLRAKRVAGCLG
jgi:hypothetical protein